jgi:hypothetical protein
MVRFKSAVLRDFVDLWFIRTQQRSVSKLKRLGPASWITYCQGAHRALTVIVRHSNFMLSRGMLTAHACP